LNDLKSFRGSPAQGERWLGPFVGTIEGMKLYLAYRWGNEEDGEGPDGWNTVLIVRAATLAEATEMADHALCNYSTGGPARKSIKPVQPFCCGILELGIDAGGSDQVAGLVFYPLIDKGVIAMSFKGYPHWQRESQTEAWREAEEATELGP
jgi:hypothetical protein